MCGHVNDPRFRAYGSQACLKNFRGVHFCLLSSPHLSKTTTKKIVSVRGARQVVELV